MNRSARAAGLAILFAGAFGASELVAQEAASGDGETSHVVDGSVLNPGATEPMDIQFEFTGSGEDLRAVILVPGTSLRVDLLEPLFGENAFTFAFHEPGGTDRIECALFRANDDSFKGDCMEEGGGAPGQMTLEPTGF